MFDEFNQRLKDEEPVQMSMEDLIEFRSQNPAGKGRFTRAEAIIARLENTIQGAKDSPDETSDYVLKNFPNMIEELKNKPELANNENVWKELGMTGLPENQRFKIYDDGTVDFETLKPIHSPFTWWRDAPGEDWAPAPLEYHDHIGIDMSSVINRVYDLDGWQINEEYLEVGDDKLLCWHYRYQGDFVGFPSNLIPNSEVEEKFWEDGFVNELQADVWIAPAGYIQREIIQWDVNYRLSDGTTVNGLEKISSGLWNINQEIAIPEMVVPPVPSSLIPVYGTSWLEYGDILGLWKYQVGKHPKETLAAYLQSENEGYRIQHLEGNPLDGFVMVIKDWSGLLWDVAIEPKETAKGGVVSVLVMTQR